MLVCLSSAPSPLGPIESGLVFTHIFGTIGSSAYTEEIMTSFLGPSSFVFDLNCYANNSQNQNHFSS